MPNITLRQIEPAVVDQIKVIAAQNGRSMQQELRLLVNRFASLPAESRQALTPLAALQVPEWYAKLWNIRLDIGSVPDAALPQRRSPFRRLELKRPELRQPEPKQFESSQSTLNRAASTQPAPHEWRAES
ncbi:FitA-like ribbon-helix-helix domain-containing protein [Arthrobacter sp. CAL618]|uniref:FitA-like ribbon-helix-helix domain-containing protein n=1 Tax=Arthrobacter sp. CAL618 TaxID=1055770 RepID=UPI0004675554|nr:hypothetical protein [Arthrobacter sp. CAL618]